MKTEQELKTAFEKEHGGLSDAYTYEDISDWWLTRLKADRRAVVEMVEKQGKSIKPPGWYDAEFHGYQLAIDDILSLLPNKETV